MIPNKTMKCKKCKYLSSDSCRDAWWYVCDHPKFEKKFPEGRCIDPYSGGHSLSCPNWCPLREITIDGCG